MCVRAFVCACVCACVRALVCVHARACVRAFVMFAIYDNIISPRLIMINRALLSLERTMNLLCH